MLTYKPGRESCEPFRQYNTQANGIYGFVPKSDAAWQSFSNWCPGDVIDNRIIQLGAVKSGEHKIRISVPDARFADQQGDIPVSIYFHGVTEGVIDNAGVDVLSVKGPESSISIKGGFVEISGNLRVDFVEVFTGQGQLIYSEKGNASIPLSKLPNGLSLFRLELENGVYETHKLMIKK